MNRLIQLSGSAPLGELYFRSIQIQEALSELGSASLHVESDSAHLNADEFLGQSVCVAFETREQSLRYFDAVVVGMQQLSMGSGGRCAYVIELRSWAWLLGKNQEFRVYQHQTVTDILANILQRHSHEAIRYVDRTTGPKRVWEYIVQFGESDLHFVRRILEQEGIYFFFEHSENQHQMVLVDSHSAHAEFPLYAELVHDPVSPTTRLTDQETIDRLSVRKTIEPARHAHTDYNFTTPLASLLSKSEGEQASYNQGQEIFEYPGEFGDTAHGERYSRFRQQEVSARQEVFHGTCSARGVAVGHWVDIVCKDNPALARKLLITHTHLSIYEAEPEAQGNVQSSFDCVFEAIDLSVPFRAERKTRKPLARGPLPAVVVGPEGREIYTDEYGRVKIQFHWDRHGKMNEYSSCWVRVATSSAGKGWGFISIPRIGQEVVVSFEDGDPDRPLVTGMAYNAEQVVPYPLPEHKTVSGWRTHSSEHGASNNFNELRFEDLKGQEYVWFQAEKDYFGLIKNDSKEEIGANAHRLIHGNLIEEIKQDVARKVLGKLSEQIEQAMHLTVNDDALVQVQGLLSVLNQGQIAVSTAGQCSVKSEGNTDMSAKGNMSLSTQSQGNFKAATSLKLTAGSSLSLNVGSTSIVLSASGISLSGPVSVAGGGAGANASAAVTTPAEPTVLPDLVSPPFDPIA